MFSFLLGLSAGALCVLNPDATRKLLASLVAQGQNLAVAASSEASRWASRVGEEVSDLVAEAREQRAREQLTQAQRGHDRVSPKETTAA
jgi:hypothetical protein